MHLKKRYIYYYEISVWLPEWSKGTDLRSVGESLVGSNPTPYRYFIHLINEFNFFTSGLTLLEQPKGKQVELRQSKILLENQCGR